MSSHLKIKKEYIILTSSQLLQKKEKRKSNLVLGNIPKLENVIAILLLIKK